MFLSRRFSFLLVSIASILEASESGSPRSSSGFRVCVGTICAQEAGANFETNESGAPSFDGAAPGSGFSTALNSGDSVLSSRTYYDGAETIGRVGREAILRCDVVHQIKKFAHLQYLDEIKKVPEERREAVRNEYKKGILQACLNSEEMYAQVLDNHIRKLLFYCDYVVSRPKDQIEEQTKQLEGEFASKMIPELKEKFGCKTQRELEEYFINEIESDFEQEKRIFVQQFLGELWLNYNLGEENFEPTAVDLRRYYEANREEYRVTPRARWQAMTVFFGVNRSKDEAFRKIAHMGNAVRRETNPKRQEKLFAEVCRVDSEDVFAKNGGYRDWTEPGSLRSEVVENAVFSGSLPVGSLSRILEDSTSLTIVRVVERVEERVKSFAEVQEDVREKMIADRRTAMQKMYEERLSERFSIEIYAISPEERQEWARTANREETSATGRKTF